MLKPCLILGSGFRRWVLGHPDNPLCSWHVLIDQVTEKLKLPRPPMTLSPVMRWERLVETGVTDGYFNPARSQWSGELECSASEVEEVARLAVGAVLGEQLKSYPLKSRRARYPRLETWESVISINFDCSILGDQYQLSRELPDEIQSNREMNRNYLYAQRSESKQKIWYPNGITHYPASIKMGLRDYGQSPYFIGLLFEKNKSRERESGIAGQGVTASDVFEGYLSTLFTNLAAEDEAVGQLNSPR